MLWQAPWWGPGAEVPVLPLLCTGGAAWLQGHAVRAGMMIARGDQVLMADADGATRWEDLELLQGRMQELLKKQSESHAAQML